MNMNVSLKLLTGLAGASMASALVGQTVFNFDLGNGDSPLFTGTYEGASGFVAAGVSANGAVEDVSIDFGDGYNLTFNNVSSWNNVPGEALATDPASLYDDHIFSAGLGADDPVNFTLSGFNTGDVVTVELMDRNGGWNAQVTLEGVVTVLSGDPAIFHIVGDGLTGQTAYAGTFTGEAGTGEGNLAAARITVVAVPEPSLFGTLLAGLSLGALALRRRR